MDPVKTRADKQKGLLVVQARSGGLAFLASDISATGAARDIRFGAFRLEKQTLVDRESVRPDFSRYPMVGWRGGALAPKKKQVG